MKSILSVLVFAGVLFALYAVFYEENPQDATWLHGLWGMKYDPDGNKKDYMEFFTDGRVDIKPNRRSTDLTCEYASKVGHVKVTCEVRGRETSISLEVSPGKDRLTNPTDAYYERERPLRR